MSESMHSCTVCHWWTLVYTLGTTTNTVFKSDQTCPALRRPTRGQARQEGRIVGVRTVAWTLQAPPPWLDSFAGFCLAQHPEASRAL